MHIELAYERVGDAVAAQVSVTIRSRSGSAPLVDLTSERSSAGAIRLAARGTVVLHLERLDLAPGDYWVDVGLHSPDWDRSYDHRWDWLPLTVVGTPNSGTLVPPHSWEVL